MHRCGCETSGMTSAEHLDWLQDNSTWFSDLSSDLLGIDVPACPGWNVERVVTHLAFGLGLGYPYALRADPDCPDEKAFADVPWPTKVPVGAGALDAFRVEVGRCIDTFRTTDPTAPCYTFQGPGVAAFWFRRAAIETTLHRMDVVEALGQVDRPMPPERTLDAIAEAVEFALPLAARRTQSELPAVLLKPIDAHDELLLGAGEPVATISGLGTNVLSALWGRSDEHLEVDGNLDVAVAWMTVVEKAFAGR